MFEAFKRAKRARHVGIALSNIIQPLQHIQGLPARFWADHYVLGFVYGLALAHSRAVAGRVSGQEHALICAEAYEVAFGVLGVKHFVRTTEVMLGGDNDFNNAMEFGSMIVLLVYGSREYEAEDIVLKARRFAQSAAKAEVLPPSSDAMANYYLMKVLFFDEIDRRLRE